MKVITQRELIRQVAKLFDSQYGFRPSEILKFEGGKSVSDTIKMLYALDAETASAEEVASIIGNDSWTSLTCDECSKSTDVVVQVGQEPDYESATANLCIDCLRKAASLV